MIRFALIFVAALIPTWIGWAFIFDATGSQGLASLIGAVAFIANVHALDGLFP